MNMYSEMKIRRLGGAGSDYAAFVQHIGVASADISYGLGNFANFQLCRQLDIQNRPHFPGAPSSSKYILYLTFSLDTHYYSKEL